ncbi:hypothetical protein GGI17_001780 [Coemansia sp. S146]|nr:hypothetical protein GGI17_001780 [Coemansia sp. S146]
MKREERCVVCRNMQEELDKSLPNSVHWHNTTIKYSIEHNSDASPTHLQFQLVLATTAKSLSSRIGDDTATTMCNTMTQRALFDMPVKCGGKYTYSITGVSPAAASYGVSGMAIATIIEAREKAIECAMDDIREGEVAVCRGMAHIKAREKVIGHVFASARERERAVELREKIVDHVETRKAHGRDVEIREKALEIREKVLEAHEKAAKFAMASIEAYKMAVTTREEAVEIREKAVEIREKASKCTETSVEIRERAVETHTKAAKRAMASVEAHKKAVNR